ncbi:MAG: hypothetical protein KAR64_05355 [Thermoplasmatales archaeon]|nr:hypothetical protein [Thermoplasmatales archaeon]
MRKIFVFMLIAMMINLSSVICISSSSVSKIELPPAFQRELFPAGITPGSWLYGFKKFSENIDLFFTFDDLAKAEKLAYYAELRLAEVKELAENGNTEFVNDLVNEYKLNLENSNELVKTAQQFGKNVTKVTGFIAVSTSIHVDILEEVLQQVPEKTKLSIQNAINYSKEGNKWALDVLEEVQPEVAAEIHLRIAEKRLLKAQEKAQENKSELVVNLILEYEERLNKSCQIAEIAKELGKNTASLEQLITEATSTHLEVLSDVYVKVPGQITKNAVEKTFNISIYEIEKMIGTLSGKNAFSELVNVTSLEKIKVSVLGVTTNANYDHD